MKHLITGVIFSVCILASAFLKAQELNCEVTVRAREVEQSNRQIFRTLENNIREFLNGQTWTDKRFKNKEKINCNIIVSVQEKNNENLKASARIKSTRPVYGSDYTTNVLNRIDKEFNFKYRRNQNLRYVEGSYTSNLTALLSYYAFLIIGLDFDTFSDNGGNPYFQKAENIVTASQSSSFDGWKQSGKDNNRYNYLDQLLSTRFQGYRKALYQYHRKGLDIMHEDPEKGRKAIFKSLKKLKKVNQEVPNSFLMDQFFRAKQEEIGNVFSKAPQDQQDEVVNIVEVLDPSNLDSYKEAMGR